MIWYRSNLLNFCFFTLSLTIWGQQNREIPTNSESFTPRYIDSLYQISNGIFQQYPDSALQLGNQIIYLSQRIGYEKGVAKGKENIARNVMHQKGDSTSFELAQEAFDYAERVGADSVLLSVINILGFGNYKLKRIDKTYFYNTLGRRYAEKSGNNEKLFLFTANAASIMAELNDFEKAKELYEEALGLLEKNPDDFWYKHVVIEVAAMLTKMGKPDAAQTYLNLAKANYAKDKDQRFATEILVNEANIQIEKKDFAQAKRLLDQAGENLQLSRYFIIALQYYIARTKVAVHYGDFDQAEAEIALAMPLAERTQYLDSKLALVRLQYEIKQEKGEFKEANALLEDYFQLKESIKFDQNQNKLRIALAESDYLKEQEILTIKLEEANLRQISIFLAALVVVLFLVGILFLVKRNEKKLKGLNAQLERQAKELNEANIMKDKLFSIIAHDFKGPVGGIKSLIDMLLEKNISPKEFNSLLPQMKNNVDHVLFSLHNLLAWGMGQLKGNRINQEKFELNSKIQGALTLLRSNIENKKITIENGVDGHSEVWADENHMEIVVRNLLSNAIKFTPEGGTIAFGTEDHGATRLFWIKDTGIGMPRDVQKKIFQQNQSVTTYGTDNEKGTGLGLAICIDMVRKNQGEIWVESQRGQGTQIFFELPTQPQKNLDQDQGAAPIKAVQTQMLS